MSAALSRDKSRASLPSNWRDRLPDPATYYAAKVPRLKGPASSGWAPGPCPFHEDRNASFAAHIGPGGLGGWKCFAGCGAGDMVSFQMRHAGQDFREAAFALIRGLA